MEPYCPISSLSLFSGIGAYEKALKNIGVPVNLVGYCEHDPLTAKCYSIIHRVDPSRNFEDVLKIVPSNLPDFDLLTFSPPCQDISSIGEHAGVSKGTRTGLMWACLDIIKEKMPSYLIMENVKTLVGKYKNSFKEYLKILDDMGYDCSAKVLRADEHGLPQIRQRLFMVGIRKGIQDSFFMWPDPRRLDNVLKDYLDIGEPIKSINRDVAYTIRIGGRKSGVDNRHNWDGYLINGREYFLSAKDCIKLMGFSDSDYDALKNAGISDSRILKVAGNSVAVTVLEDVFKSLLVNMKVKI